MTLVEAPAPAAQGAQMPPQGKPSAERPERPLVDPCVAKHGGTRKSRKDAYEFRGMMDLRSWRRTQVHEHTAWYGCAQCGVKFSSPHAAYTHLAKVHDR